MKGKTMRTRLSQLRAIVMFMVLLVTVNMVAMASAEAGRACPQAAVSVPGGHSDQPLDHHDRVGAGDCCSDMHCCPIVPRLPHAEVILRTARLPSPPLDDETPLLLVRAIDPPPRTWSV